MTLRARLSALAFALLLLLPTLDQLLNLSAGFKSTENRRMDALPEFRLANARKFLGQFGQYYRDHFGWRNALFYGYSRWKYFLLGQSPLPEKVVVGKNNWFYLGNSYNKIVDQHRGLVPLSADSARIIVNHLLDRQRDLARQGARLYVLIAPDSYTIYPEHMPGRLRPNVSPSRLDVLAKAVLQTNLPFIDIRDTLLTAKRDHVLYYQTDTHWNNYGVLVGCSALVNRIRQDVPTVPPVRLTDYKIDVQRGVAGDLTTMLALQAVRKDSVFYDVAQKPERTARHLAEIPNPVSGFPSTRFAGPGAGNLLFIGDSFSHGMMQFLPGYFRNAYFARGRTLPMAVLQAEKPNIVVIEVVERNLIQLATF